MNNCRHKSIRATVEDLVPLSAHFFQRRHEAERTTMPQRAVDGESSGALARSRNHGKSRSLPPVNFRLSPKSYRFPYPTIRLSISLLLFSTH